MGLSRILLKFLATTISFTCFYLFIMLSNAEAKIGELIFTIYIITLVLIGIISLNNMTRASQELQLSFHA